MTEPPNSAKRDYRIEISDTLKTSETKGFQLSQHHAAVLVALIALVGGVAGHFISGMTSRDQNTQNVTAQTKQHGERLQHEMILQSTRQNHEISIERQKFIQQTISNIIGKGTVDQQQTALRFYAQVGIIEDPYARKILDLPRDELPVATPGRGSVAPSVEKFTDGKDLAGLPRPKFAIVEHRLASSTNGVAIRWVPSDFLGAAFAPQALRFIVIDFSAGDRIEQLLLGMKQARGSVHIAIDRDGSVVQMVPLDRVAYHAGASSYAGLSGLNQHSIGIELINNGRLNRSEDGSWLTWLGSTVPPERVLVESTEDKQAWERYTEAQLASLAGVVQALKAAYPNLKDIVGQSDISPGRKLGPGPALNVSSLNNL